MNLHRLTVWLTAALLFAPFAAQPAAGQERRTRVVAHRGLLLDAPENTLANFRACLELNYGFEVDVRRSKDGQLVCVHDSTVDRTSNGKGAVSELTLQELKLLDVGGWFAPSFRGQQIPTLDEVFELLAKHRKADVVIAVDVKADDTKIEADIVHAAARHDVLDRLLMIGRTIDNADVRRRFIETDKNTHVACLANRPGEFQAALQDEWADWVYVRYVPTREQLDSVHEARKRAFIAGVNVAGRQVENWRRAAVRGMDAILTDHAPALSRQLRADQERLHELSTLLKPHFNPPPKYRLDFGVYRSPLRFADGGEVDSPEQWQRRRREILAEWHEMLGAWPPLLKKPLIKIVETTRRENFTQHRVHVQVHPGEHYAEGHLLIPDGEGPFPAVLVPFYESKTSVGLGERGRGTHDYGLQLARRGFVTLSIGTPGSITNPDKRTRDLLTDAGDQRDRQPLTLLAYAAANCHTALAQHAAVDAERIGIVGLSYGGKWSMFASCLHEKFACAVWSDPGIVFNEKNSNVNYWEPWYLGYEKGVRRPAGVPNDKRPRTGLYKRLIQRGRDLNDLHALICPRPVLVAGGTEDPPQNWRALNHLRAVNQKLGHSSRVAMTSRKTHIPTPEALEKTLAFLERFLKYQ